jgi:hypothetical protein
MVEVIHNRGRMLNIPRENACEQLSNYWANQLKFESLAVGKGGLPPLDFHLRQDQSSL